MKQLTTKILVIFLIGLSVNMAQAQSVLYFKGGLGAASQSSNNFAGGSLDYNMAAFGSFMLSLGVNVGPNFMTELEFSSRSASLNQVNGTPAKGDLSAGLLALNAYLKLPINYSYNFLLGAGVGILSAELSDDLTGNFADGSGFASQLIVGVEGQVSSNVDMSFEVRWLNADNMSFDGTSGIFNEDFSYSNAAYMIGVKYNF